MLYIIYCIWVKTEEGVLRYYGHTQNMRVRKDKHKCDHKAWVKAGKPKRLRDVPGITRSVYVLEHEDWRIDKVDEIECDDKKDAEKLEGEWILKNDCVNMMTPGRTQQEYQKQYRETHKEETKEYMKQYREEHKEEIAEQQKQYQETHTEYYAEYFKQYRETHKAELAAKQKEKVTCEVCGLEVSKRNIAVHRKSKKHLAALNALNALNLDINIIV